MSRFALNSAYGRFSNKSLNGLNIFSINAPLFCAEVSSDKNIFILLEPAFYPTSICFSD